MPSLRESLFIATFTRSKTRTPAGQEMLRRAFRVHGGRLGLTAALLAAFALAVWLATRPARPPLELLADTTRPASLRLTALPKVDLENETDYKRVLEIAEGDGDPQFVGEVLNRLIKHAGQDAEDKTGRRRQILETAQRMLKDRSRGAEVRTAALAAITSLNSPHVTLTALRGLELSDGTDGPLIDKIRQYLEGLDLTRLSTKDRPAVLLDVVELLRTGNNPRIIDACRNRLDQLPAAVLRQWLLEAFSNGEDVDLDAAAKETIGVYIGACRRGDNARRIEEIERGCERRLKEMVGARLPKWSESLELEYIFQTMVLLQSQTDSAAFSKEGWDAVTSLLCRWKEVEDKMIVRSAVEAYVELRPYFASSAADAPRDALREILRAGNDGDLMLVRETAAKALGRLQDEEVITDLIEIAGKEKEMVDVRQRRHRKPGRNRRPFAPARQRHK